MHMTQLEANINMLRHDVLTHAKIFRPFCSLEKIFVNYEFIQFEIKKKGVTVNH